MYGIQLLYRNVKGSPIQITNNLAQYLFLEPKEKVVIRYYFVKNGLEVNTTKLLNEVKETEVVSVKLRKPVSTVLSKISDFKEVVDRKESAIYFDVDFNEGDTTFLDALFESKVEERLKVKIYTIDSGADSFENENTVTDGPDAFVKVVDITLTPEFVFYTYVYRRQGRLKKAPSQIRYESLAEIMSIRLLAEGHPDASFDKTLITKGLIDAGFLIDYSADRIYRDINNKKINITLEEFGNIIKENASPTEILNLLKTKDLLISEHQLILKGELELVSCDSVCSLPEAKPLAIVDERI